MSTVRGESLAASEASLRPHLLGVLACALFVHLAVGLSLQAVPVLAPALLPESGVALHRLGLVASTTAAGTILGLLAARHLALRLSPPSTLQASCLLLVAGVALVATASTLPLFAAALVLGLGRAQTTPAAAQMLGGIPGGSSALAFSVLQSGAPAGGVLCGILLPAVAEAHGWRVSLAVAAAVSLFAAFAVQLLRRTGPHVVHGGGAEGRHLANPLALLRRRDGLPQLTVLACALAAAQIACMLFAVSYMVEGLGRSLGEAGVAFAAMNAAGLLARPLVGWLADRAGRPTVNLLLQGAVASLAVLAFSLLPHGPSTPLLLVSASLVGVAAFSWQGLVLAEVARRAGAGQVGDAVAGVLLLVMVTGLGAGPALASLVLWLTGSWSLYLCGASLALALVTLTAGSALLRSDAGVRRLGP